MINFILLFYFLSSCSKPFDSEIVEVRDFGSNPGNLKMFQFVPKGLNKNIPLVVVLHGCMQNAETIAIQSGWNKLANHHNFMVVYSQQKRINNVNKCFQWFKNADIQRDKGETASIKQMIDYTLAKYKLDSSRVFITGLSAGGAMTSVMLANYPYRFSAGAIMSGIPFGAANNLKEGLKAMKGETLKPAKVWANYIKVQNPDYNGKYPKLAIFQGVDDPYVNHVNADELVKQYSAIHHIDNEVVSDNNFNDNPDVTQLKYQNQDKKTVLVHYKITNLGHAIAIDPGKGKKQGGKIAKYAVDINFHSPYWAAKFFGLID